MQINWTIVFWHIVLPLTIAIFIVICFKMVKYLLHNFFWVILVAVAVWVSVFLARKTNPKIDLFRKVVLTNVSSDDMGIETTDTIRTKFSFKAIHSVLKTYPHYIALLVSAVIIVAIVGIWRYRMANNQ